MKLTDINWEPLTITFIQSKTGKSLQLPLHINVGNTISDYILNARPKTDSPYVFIRTLAPHSKLSDFGKITTAFRKYRELAFPNQFHNYGIHSIRNSLATSLLNKETP